MSKKILYGIFEDEEVLLSSVKEIRSNNIEIEEVFSPFPIHGMDDILGLALRVNDFLSKKTKLVSFKTYSYLKRFSLFGFVYLSI